MESALPEYSPRKPVSVNVTIFPLDGYPKGHKMYGFISQKILECFHSRFINEARLTVHNCNTKVIADLDVVLVSSTEVSSLWDEQIALKSFDNKLRVKRFESDKPMTPENTFALVTRICEKVIIYFENMFDPISARTRAKLRKKKKLELQSGCETQ